MYHKTVDYTYSGALCGARVHWTVLAMNDDMVQCKRCQKLLQGTEDNRSPETSKEVKNERAD